MFCTSSRWPQLKVFLCLKLCRPSIVAEDLFFNRENLVTLSFECHRFATRCFSFSKKTTCSKIFLIWSIGNEWKMISVISYNTLVVLKQAEGFSEKLDGLAGQSDRFSVFQGNEWEQRFVDCLLESLNFPLLYFCLVGCSGRQFFWLFGALSILEAKLSVVFCSMKLVFKELL